MYIIIKFLEYYQICPSYSHLKICLFYSIRGFTLKILYRSRKCLNKYNVLSSILKIRNDIIYYNS